MYSNSYEPAIAVQRFKIVIKREGGN